MKYVVVRLRYENPVSRRVAGVKREESAAFLIHSEL